MEANQTTPSEGEENVIASYHNDMREVELAGYKTGVRKARNALYWTGALVFLGEMFAMFVRPGEFNIYVVIIALFEAAIFVTLALWTKRKPYTAIVAGLIAFIGIILISAVINTYVDGGVGFVKSLFSGFIVKIVILLYLVKAINDGKALEDARKENV